MSAMTVTVWFFVSLVFRHRVSHSTLPTAPAVLTKWSMRRPRMGSFGVNTLTLASLTMALALSLSSGRTRTRILGSR